MEIRKDLQGTANGKYGQPTLCAPVHENTGFCGQTVSKSTSVHEIVGSGGQDIKQLGFYMKNQRAQQFRHDQSGVQKYKKKKKRKSLSTFPL